MFKQTAHDAVIRAVEINVRQIADFQGNSLADCDGAALLDVGRKTDCTRRTKVCWKCHNFIILLLNYGKILAPIAQETTNFYAETIVNAGDLPLLAGNKNAVR
jgi:hypothetical protein